MASPLLFVYGSLLAGPLDAPVRRALRACRPAGTAWIRGRLYALGPYPGAKTRPGRSDRVWGTLYRLQSAKRTLRQLDAFEDYRPGQHAASEYLRCRTAARRGAHGRALICWVYFYNRTVCGRAPVPDGDYRGHLAHRSRSMGGHARHPGPRQTL